MLLDQLPKINIALGVLVLMFFFLPWVSIDCGKVTLVKLSGYELATGALPVDRDILNQASGRIGAEASALAAFEEDPRVRPQLYLFLVALSAVGIVGLSVRMLDEARRPEVHAAAGLSTFGLLILITAAVARFGFAIPQDAAVFVKTSYTIGFYGTLIPLAGVDVLALYWIKEDLGWAFRKPPAQLPAEQSGEPPETLEIMEKVPAVGDQLAETLALKVDEKTSEGELNILEIPETPRPAASQPAPSAALSPGARTCPACGVVVGPYQVKCMKCGAKIKPRT